MGTNKNSCKTAAVMNLLSRGTGERVLPAQPKEPPARDIEIITDEILDAKRAGGEAVLTIGRCLIEAKGMLPHGEWLPWLTERIEYSERIAQQFMQIARNYSNPNTLSDLGKSKALMLLALPAETRDEFIAEPHLVNGEEKNVIDMTSRELEAAIKERDAALKAAEQAKVDQSAAEQARAKLSQDMALANERIAGLNAEVEEHSAKAREAQDAAARLEKELEELRAKPVDVAVEADPAAIEAARKEAEKVMQAKVDKAKKAQEKAQAQVMEINSALQRAKMEREDALIELEKLREQAKLAEKRAALAGNEDLVLFRTIFDQAQEQVNKLGGVLMKFRNKDPEKAEGLAKAMLALAEKIKGVAQQH